MPARRRSTLSMRSAKSVGNCVDMRRNLSRSWATSASIVIMGVVVEVESAEGRCWIVLAAKRRLRSKIRFLCVVALKPLNQGEVISLDVA